MSGRTTLQSVTFIVSMTALTTARAFQLDYSLQASAGFSDNINESVVDPVSQSFLIPRLNFQIDEQGAQVQARAAGQIEYRDYLGGDFDNELRGQLSSIVNWTIAPQRLNFDFEDYAAVAPVNILATNAPGNLQQTNVFTLGPSLNFRLDPTLNAQADLRLTNSSASQTQDFDSDRVLGALRLLKQLDPTTQFSGNISAENAHFTDAGADPDYRKYEVFGRYQQKLRDLSLDFTLGYTHLDFSSGDSHSGLLTRGKVTWTATAESSFSVAFARQFSDAAQDMTIDPSVLATGGTGGTILPGTTAITSQVFLDRRIDLGYVFQNERYSLRVAPFFHHLDYQQAAELDQNAHGGVIGAGYRLTKLWALGLDAIEETRKYTFIDRRDEDLRLDLYLSDQFTRQWSWRLDLIRNERNSTAAEQGFRENLAMLTFIFKR